MPERVMENAECQAVTLEPFIHQVGGHSSMLRFDDRTVCKPLISREHHFYQCMPNEMKEFTPQYRGVTEVLFEEDSDGYMTLVAYPIDPKSGRRTTTPASSSPSSGGDTAQSDSDGEQPSSSNPPSSSQARSSRSRHRFRMKRSGSVELVGRRKYSSSSGTEETLDNGHNPYGLNQWQLRCHKKTIDKLRKSSQGSGPHKFMLLENLIWQFKLPCVLDLKMGTRQHGDDASERKKVSQSSKCETTTSGKLGVRLCGMQVYQSSTREYICQDKYHGRKLTEKSFLDSLAQFVHNGRALRTDIMDSILVRLHRLKAMLSKQNTFRFYSSSLLIMYDGADWDMYDQDNDDNSSSGSSVSDLRATSSSSMTSQTTDVTSSNTQGCDVGGASGRSDGGQWAGSSSECSQSPPKIKKTSGVSARAPRVDVRMIDFAHVTHQGFRGDRIVHNGPDHGYLLGLQNLISMFQKIKERSRAE